MSASDVLLAYRATSVVEAHALVARLAEAGIVARVLGEPLQGAYGGIRLGGMERPEVWVAGTDRASAEPVIAAWQSEHHGAGEIARSRRFQFSLLLALAATGYVALVAGAIAMSETARNVFVPLVDLLFFGGVAAIAWAKVRARRRSTDEPSDSNRDDLES